MENTNSERERERLKEKESSDRREVSNDCNGVRTFFFNDARRRVYIYLLVIEPVDCISLV